MSRQPPSLTLYLRPCESHNSPCPESVGFKPPGPIAKPYCSFGSSAATAAQFPAPGSTIGNPVMPDTGVLLYVS
jgi:hypothetical protein